MAIHLVCPNGHDLIAYETQAGTQMRCPKCLTLAQVPGVLEDDGLELGEKPVIPKLMLPPKPKPSAKQKAKRADRNFQLRSLRLGLGLYSLRLTLILSVPFLNLLARIVGMFVPAAREVFTVLGTASGIAGPTVGVVAALLCMRLPRIRSLLMGSIALDVALLAVAVAVLLAPPERGHITMWELVQFALVAASWMVLVLILRRVADFLKEWGYAQQTLGLFGVGAALIILPTFVLFCLALFAALLGGLGALIAMILMIFLIIPFWMFYFRFLRLNLKLIGGLRQSIREDVNV